MTPFPNCQYCGKPLSWNEYDNEPGAGGFFSSHFSCASPDPRGEYVVETRRGGMADPRDEGFRRFNNERRARGEADLLAGSNYYRNGLTFRVLYQGRFVADYPARLAERGKS